LGDVPHTWISAEYVLAVRGMFAYERIVDRSLVLAAGIPGSWLDDGDEVAVSGLPTHHGTLALRLRRVGRTDLAVSVRGLDVPPGGIVVRPPMGGPIAAVDVNGRPATTFDVAGATVTECPVDILFRC
jgi:hypothetical protein